VGKLITKSTHDLQLLHEVCHAYPDLSYDDLLVSGWRLSQGRGVDFATALFYDQIRQSVRHRSFIGVLESLVPDFGCLPEIKGKVLLSPAYCARVLLSRALSILSGQQIMTSVLQALRV
jgi:hypothetical protein